MSTIEIAAKRWSQALDEFSAIHEGWLVSLEILSPSFGAQPEITNLPLLGVPVEPHGAAIAIAVAQSAVDHIAHMVQAPARVWMERIDSGAEAALEIESADGTKTILRLKTAAPPETVDGVARGP